MPEAALEVVSNPIVLFRQWLEEAKATELNDPVAMTLATATADGRPSARMVLLKDVDDRGFVFYTNKQSNKAGQLAATHHAALLFHWKSLRRQVRVEGPVEDVSDAEADLYFQTRARISRLGAIASDQSRPLPDRAELERRLAEVDARYPGNDVPRPAHWSGYRVRPEMIEFWKDMPFRLHDRMVYRRQDDFGWRTERLYP